MTSHDVSAPPPPLFELGWRQGVTFSAPGAAYEVNRRAGDVFEPARERAAKQRERLVLISHDCDLRSGEESYAEALICKQQDPVKQRSLLARWDKFSPRMFIVDPAAAWVADARHRIKVAKSDLAVCASHGSAMDALRHDRFVAWLARRYDRPAVDDALHDGFHAPAAALLRALESEHSELLGLFNAAVHEMRVTLPSEASPPFEIGIVYLTKSGLSEREAEAIDELHARLVEAATDDVSVRPSGVVEALDDIPFRVIRRTQPLIFDYLSSEDDAAPPPRRVAP